ncbi:hypothetical protein [Streptomyces rimosus]
MASETRVPSQAAPAADLPKCSDVGDPNGGNAFAGRSFGVPASVTLGADWTTYTATLTNASAKEMKSFELSGKVLSYVYSEGERDLSPYSDLQYWDTTQHDWKTLKDADGKARGTIPAPKMLKPRESVHVKLRFRVHKDLPMDHAYDAFTGITGHLRQPLQRHGLHGQRRCRRQLLPPRGLRPRGGLPRKRPDSGSPQVH